jgi:Domain of unknown function (DUF1877)
MGASLLGWWKPSVGHMLKVAGDGDRWGRLLYSAAVRPADYSRMLVMSMTTEYVRLRPHEFTEFQRLLLDGPREAYEYACDLQMGDEDKGMSPRGTHTDKAWAGLQHLLAKAGMPVDIIGGGEPLSDDIWGIDPPRLLTAADVAKASRFLDGTSFASFAEHYDPAELISAGVYPGIWDKDWALPYLEDYYGRLAALFQLPRPNASRS